MKRKANQFLTLHMVISEWMYLAGPGELLMTRDSDHETGSFIFRAWSAKSSTTFRVAPKMITCSIDKFSRQFITHAARDLGSLAGSIDRSLRRKVMAGPCAEWLKTPLTTRKTLPTVRVHGGEPSPQLPQPAR